QASGLEVDGLAQVCMNLLDIDITPPAMVFGAIKGLAEKHEVDVIKSEIVGLIPERAIIGAAATTLQLPDAAAHILEAKIRETKGPTLDGWLDELAGGAPTPGGGSAAALAGTLAAALVAMAARIPAEVAKHASRVLELAEELQKIGNKNARSDAEVADGLAVAAIAGAEENVRVNVAAMSDPGKGRALLEGSANPGAAPRRQPRINPTS